MTPWVASAKWVLQRGERSDEGGIGYAIRRDSGRRDLVGQFVDVVITETQPNSLRGRVRTRDEYAAA
jgi:TRAM domain